MTFWSSVVVVLLAGVFHSAAAADWGQWRGPERNGIVAESPPLLDALPKGGPKLVWKSERILGGGGGGYGSVVVARGKVYVYSNWKYRVPFETRTIDAGVLERLGWSSEMPEDLRAKIESARLSEERAKTPAKELRRWINDWMGKNIPKEQRKFRRYAYRRLSLGERAVPAEVLTKAAAVANTPFENQAVLDRWYDAQGIEPKWRKEISKFVATSRPSAYDRFFCLDAATGKTIWKKEYPGRHYVHSCSSTPCIARGCCYVQGSDGYAYCFDADTGREIWRVKTKAAPRRYTASSFVVQDGVAVLLGGPLTGFDPETGAIVWTQPTVRSDYASAAYWRHGGKTYLVCNGARETVCFEAKTGKILWRVPGGGWSTPAVVGDRMVVFTNNRRVGLIAYALSVEGARKLWSIPFTDRGASPVIFGGHVYVVGGRGAARAKCIALETGKVMWDQKVRNTEIASPVAVDGKILVAVGTNLSMFRATPDPYTSLGEANLRLVTCISPAVAEGRVYLRQNEAVVCYDLKK